MKLPVEVFGDVGVVHTPEELSYDNSVEFETFLATLDRVKLIIDLDGTETLDSAGLTSLLNVQDELRRCAGDLKISTSNTMNQKILEITRLDQQLDVFESVLEAVKSFT